MKMTKPKVITLSIIGLYANFFCDFLVEKVVHFDTQCDYSFGTLYYILLKEVFSEIQECTHSIEKEEEKKHIHWDVNGNGTLL